MAKVSLTNTYQKYPAYKDSGVEWLGKIPEHWDINSLKTMLIERKEKNIPIKTRDILSLSMERGVFPYSEKTGGGNKAKEDLTSYRITRPGDIVVNSMNVVAGSVGLSEYFGAVSPVYYPLYLRDKVNSIEFFASVFSSSSFQKSLLGLGNGILVKKSESSGKLNTIRLRIPMQKLNAVPLPIPSVKEQERIAKFLDEQTVRIDKSISKKQRLIKLLKEKRTSFINKKITEATGEKLKLKQCFNINPPRQLAKTLKDNEMVAFVPMEEISDIGELLPQERKYADVKSGFTYFENGDVVLAKITPCFENGKAGVMKDLSKGFGFGTTEFVVMRPKENILPEYLYYIVYSDEFREKGEVEMRGTAGQKRVSVTFVKNYLINLPSLEAQKDIVNEIRNKLNQYYDTEVKLSHSIEMLKEFKSSLISHAVTGKIKI